MLKRLSLYFKPYQLSDRYLTTILQLNNLHPLDEYDKEIHRIPMLNCILQVFTELAENDETGYSKQQIEYYKNLIVTLKTKENT